MHLRIRLVCLLDESVGSGLKGREGFAIAEVSKLRRFGRWLVGSSVMGS